MTISVADIDSRLSYALNDEDHVRWTLPERYAWINDAAKEIVILRPAAGGALDKITLVEGPVQTIPSGAMLLLDVVRNITSDDKPGRPVQRADRDLLDGQNPNWYAMRKAESIKHYTYDDRLPREFYVYPPAKAGIKLEVLSAKAPADVADTSDTLDLDSSYIGPVVSYVLYRALTKDSEYAQGAVGNAHLQAFMTALGQKNQTSLMAGPKGAVNEAP